MWYQSGGIKFFQGIGGKSIPLCVLYQCIGRFSPYCGGCYHFRWFYGSPFGGVPYCLRVLGEKYNYGGGLVSRKITSRVLILCLSDTRCIISICYHHSILYFILLCWGVFQTSTSTGMQYSLPSFTLSF